MRKLVGREYERILLENALKSDKSELIAVYGRRRVGKTFLVRQALEENIRFEISGLHNGSLTDQLENFHRSLVRNKMKCALPESWMEAFGLLERYLERIASQKKKVVFIDEFPWLATRRSKFLMAFEHFWNSFASKRTDLLVIISGSAASYMVKNIIRNKGGLHNRITEKIRLLPFTLHETKLFLESQNIKYTHYDILRIYMALGGIPYYLEKLQKGESVHQAVDRLCFMKQAPLNTEFKDVFASLFENHQRHSAVVRALTASRKGLTRNEISKKTKISAGGRLTATLEELEESGFIESCPSFEKIKKDALYRLNDEYSVFFIRFIEKSAMRGKGTWQAKANSQSYKSWSGYSFEMICLKHAEQIKAALGIAAVHSENYSWADKGAQIDLLIDRADNVINLCEMKFHTEKFTITKAYAEELRNKVNVFRKATDTTKNIFITMITAYGVKENPYSLEIVQNALTMDCLFEPMRIISG